MNIGGVTKFTMLDFPHELAITVYAQGCNRTCDYCHNKGLIPFKPGALDWKEVWSMIVKRKDFISAVVFSGGEPTFQDDISESCSMVRSLGLKVGLHTNGEGSFLKDIEHLDYCLLSHPTNVKLQIIKSICNFIELSEVKWIDGKWENIKTLETDTPARMIRVSISALEQ